MHLSGIQKTDGEYLEPSEGASPAGCETLFGFPAFTRVSFAQCQEDNMCLVERREEWSCSLLREEIATLKEEISPKVSALCVSSLVTV